MIATCCSISRVAGLLILLAVLANPARAATFEVNSTADSDNGNCADGTCTLREAINLANANAGSDEIHFEIAAAGEIVITPAAVLPTITAPVVIDGYTQSGSSPNSDPVASNATLRVRIDGIAMGDSESGFSVCANDVTIRGLSITRFTRHGVQSGNSNTNSGCGFSVTGVKILGNFIGLTTDGSSVAANEFSAVVGNRSVIQIGGENVADRNILSGNFGRAIQISTSFANAANGSSLLGNLIGTDRTGIENRGNGAAMTLGGLARLVRVGSDTAPNRIRFNNEGIFPETGSDSVTQISWHANHFSDQAGIAVDLGHNGSTDPLDVDDVDTGANGRQNAPVLTQAGHSTNGLSAVGTLDVEAAVSDEDFTIALYANDTCDGTHGEGQRYLGSAVVNLTQTTGESFSINVPTNDPLGDGVQITAIATGPNGSSEFSQCIPIVDVPTFVVNSINDPGVGGCDASECTLREAITAANAESSSQINFAIPAGQAVGGVFTIGLTTMLPSLNAPVVIVGFSQSGAVRNTGAVDDNAIIKIEVRRSSGTVAHGFRICSNSVHINGLSINNFSSFAIATQVMAGGTCTLQGTNVRIEGNYIGLRPDGTASPNGTAASGLGGILIDDTQVLVGSSNLFDRNLISGNTGSGISVIGAGATGSRIVGNFIGAGRAAADDRRNSGAGIVVGDATDIEIGGGEPGAGNLVRFNAVGVLVRLTADRIAIRGNEILTHTQLAIDLSNSGTGGIDGVTPNDTDDTDIGANLRQNFPVLASAVASTESLQLSGLLDVPGIDPVDPTYTLDFFENITCHASGNGEAAIYLGSATRTLNVTNSSFTVDLPVGDVGNGHFITATATTAAGRTSELSACTLVTSTNIFGNSFE